MKTIKDSLNFKHKPGTKISDIIQSQYLLSPELAEKYARMGFMEYHGLHTKKRKLADLSYSDLDYFTSLLMKYWTDTKDNPMKIQLDYYALRDMKLVITHKDILEEHKNLIKKKMQNIVDNHKMTKILVCFF